MKLNEFTQQVNEIDLSSFIGDRGAAAVRSGLGSLFGRSSGQMSTQERQAYDTYVKSFVGNYANELNQAVNSGLVTMQPSKPNQASPAQADKPAQAGQTQPGQAQADKPAQAGQAQAGQAQAGQPAQTPAAPGRVRDPKTGRFITTKPQAQPGQTTQPGAQAFGQMATQLSKPGQATQPTAQAQGQTPAQPSQADLIAQRRQQKQQAAAQTAQQQMAPMSKLPANQFAQTAANTRQQKQATAAQTAQQQMAPMSKLPANQFAQTAATTRQQKQAAATQAATQQMAPVSRLPATQTAQTASTIRKKKQQAAQVRESIINEQMSISQFIYNKISKGLSNIQNINQYLPGFKQKAQEIENAYIAAGGGSKGDRAIKNALTQLAQQSYVILKSEPSSSTNKTATSSPSSTSGTQKTPLKPTVSTAEINKMIGTLSDIEKKKLLNLIQKSLQGQKISIGGQKLDPNDPKDAKTIANLMSLQAKK